MKAAQINEYGPVNVVTVNEVSTPKISEGQVLVEVHAASINPFDWKVREGLTQQMGQLEFPATLGGDFAGVVKEVGADVTKFKPGDEVYGQAGALSGNGSFAEFTPVKDSSVGLKPTSVDFVTAAALPLVGVSAYQALVEHAELKSGQKVLIHGGAGGIGSHAIQLAKHLGSYVATTVSSDDTEFVKSLGADEVIDYKNQDFVTMLSNYDVVYDLVDGETYKKSFEVLKPNGIIVSMVSQPDEELMKKYDVRVVAQFTQVTTERLGKLAELVDSGAIKAKIDKTFPLDQAAEALEHVKSDSHHGKVVLLVHRDTLQDSR